ncbi:MAG: GMC oxidoreductase [Leptolyngbya sp. IPPAS B-1204]|nr:MAG: GMC family oxidoreductase [Leptolyngbya sp. IPPAS B-1204]
MLINANEFAENAVINTEICIIGAGPAGITLAREFLGQTTEVYLLESGDTTSQAAIQTLSECQTYGDPFLSPQATRHRQFGGNSNIWAIKLDRSTIGVRYAPLDAIDFERRDWLPYSGWPFPKSHLDPFYERAQAVCQAGPYAYDAEAWQRPDSQPLPLNPDRFETAVFQFGPRQVFYQDYRNALAQANNIKVCVDSTVVEIEAHESRQAVTRVKVSTFAGKQFWIAAKFFVSAQGGIENARLLLASNRQQPAGLGNQYDVVGRYFMDHPLVDAGMLIPRDPNLFNKTALYDLRWVDNTPILGKLAPSPTLMQQKHLLNLAVLAFPRPSWRQFKAMAAFKTVTEAGVRGKLPDQLPQHLWHILGGLDYIARAGYLAATQHQSLLHGFGRGGWSEMPDNRQRFRMFQFFFQTEQAPDPSNRVFLSAERDRFGYPKAALHWQWGSIDRSSAAHNQKLLAEKLANAGIGELTYDAAQAPALCSPSGVAHHMGTTRMHADPKQGVVDQNCRVHQLANLYVAGSSVFPTGGSANPTLTIVALSLRLADHLKQAIKTTSVAGLMS